MAGYHECFRVTGIADGDRILAYSILAELVRPAGHDLLRAGYTHDLGEITIAARRKRCRIAGARLTGTGNADLVSTGNALHDAIDTKCRRSLIQTLRHKRLIAGIPRLDDLAACAVHTALIRRTDIPMHEAMHAKYGF